MNTTILQKCITELQKETPDLSYLRGMLETLLEMQSNDKFAGIKVDNGTTYATYNEDTLIKSTYPSLTNNNGGFPPVAKMVSADTPEGRAVEAALASLQGLPTINPGVIEKNITLN